MPSFLHPDLLLGFVVAATILIAIPGPSVVFTIGRALSYGRAVALATVVGNTLGLLLICVLVALGLGVVVAQSVVVFTVIKLAGAAYLLWLGFRAIVDRRGFERAEEAGAAMLSRPTAVRQGFVVGVSNPKAFMIFAAVLPQFVDRESGQVAAQMLLLGLVAATIGLLSDSVWAIVASRVRDWFTASPRRGRAIGAAGGMSMIGLGVGMAVTGRPE